MQKRPNWPYRLEFAPIVLADEFAITGAGIFTQTDAPITRLHVHDCLEVGYCYDGSGIFVVEDKVFPYSAGDVSVINNLEMHLARSAAGTQSHWTFLALDPARLVGAQAPERELLRIEPLGGRGFPNILKPAADPAMGELVRRIIRELNEKKSGYRAAVRSSVWTLMVSLHRIAQERTVPAQSVRREVIERVAPALEHLAAHYHEPVYVEQLAVLCHTSITNLRRWMHAATGASPKEYLTRLRVQMATTLLTSTTRSILDISLAVGYPTLSSFNRHFRRYIGVAPRDWRHGKPAQSR